MRARLLNPRLATWIALWVLAFASLAPTISRLAWTESTWLEVCTAAGSKLVAASGDVDHGAASGKVPTASLFDHCPYCALQHAGAMLPMALPALALLPLRFALPERFFSAPRTPHAWTASQPRGPPLSN